MKMITNNKKGMEMVQVAILVAIAIGLGLLFKEQIGDFISNTFETLNDSSFDSI
ncbi:MAG TPA: Flp1 family type IVb pilin [Anaerovoracaceae bacterium]|nr:Flp1 family type IVb pilin [Anaerovoracaceae bacterium]